MLLLVAAPRFSAADPIHWNANWNYARSGGDAQDVRWSLGETYGASLDRDVSRAMDIGAALRYTQRRDSDDEWQGTLNPSLSLGLRNDLFSFQVGGNESRRKRSSAEEAINRALSSSFSTSLAEMWPQLRLNYSRSENYDKESPPRQDNWNESYNGSLSHMWGGLEAFYSGRYSRGEDEVSATENDSTSHLAKLDGNYHFWDQRLQLSFSTQYNENENNTYIKSAAGELIFIPQFVSQQYAGFDDNPIFSALPSNSALGDGREDVPALVWSEAEDEDLSIAARLNSQDLDQIEVVFLGEPDPFFRSQLQASVYISNNNRDWTQSSVGITSRWEEDAVFERWSFILDLNQTLNVPYVKIVLREPAGVWDPVQISECIWSRVVIAAGDETKTSNTFKRYKYQTNAQLRPFEAWLVTASYGYDLSEPGEGAETEEVQQTYGVQWHPAAVLSLQAFYSENETMVEKQETETGRNWTLAAQWDPLGTLATALSFNCSEILLDSDLQNRTYTISSSLVAQLLPDWSASLNGSWTQNEDMVNNSETTTTSWTLDTSTQLRPSLRLTMYVNYGSTTTEAIRGEEDSSYVDGGINLNYRPSDALQSNTSISYDGDDDSVRVSTSVSLRLSNDLQANVGAALTFEDDVTQNYTASLIWLMTQRFSLRQGVQYARADLAQWSYSANASYNF